MGLVSRRVEGFVNWVPLPRLGLAVEGDGEQLSCGEKLFQISRTIDIVVPSGDSNLGLQVSVYLNLAHALNRLATTAGCNNIFICLKSYINM